MQLNLWNALVNLAGRLWNALINLDYHVHVNQPDGTSIMFGRWSPDGYFVYATCPHQPTAHIHQFRLTRQQAYDEATRAGAPYNALCAFDQNRTAFFDGWRERR